MLSSYLTMQNAIMARNLSSSQMVVASSHMLSSASFGNSQPLQPAFGYSDSFELQNKANETKISYFNKLIEAIQKKLGKDIKKSTPKYSGINYKA